VAGRAAGGVGRRASHRIAGRSTATAIISVAVLDPDVAVTVVDPPAVPRSSTNSTPAQIR
jgi:hypothetical protein